MTQHSGPAGPEDDDYGPPDWFAADAAPEPARGPEPGRPAGVGELGLVTASDLPSGRRRRRSALEAEQSPGLPGGADAGDDRGRGAGTAGHGGVADSAPAFPEERTGRRSGRTRRGGAPRGASHEDADRDASGEDETGRAASGRGARGRGARERDGAGRRARAEESVDPGTLARDICLRLLTGAAKSRKQLADALRKREIPDEVAEEVLTRLEEVGLIDDGAFARAWVESRHSVRGLSRRALAQELRTKGVSGELAEQALAQLDHDDETEAARSLVDRRLRSTRGLERQTRTRRLVGMLARRGYSEGLAFRVVREALDEEESADGSEDAGYEDAGYEDAGYEDAGYED
ncbi:regulatory protein RecX [Kitasatospora misakiensis]|uniref:Regulatory protein RecX n=1 Tax=Kitasatospora misakiensis TaxID=67330 RepID=A0ABW0X8G4_9ACTN